MKKFALWLLLLFFPLNVFAYSNKIIVSGEPIGIEIHSKGVYIVDFYQVNGTYPAKESGLQKGDRIIEIKKKEIKNSKDMQEIIQKEGVYPIKIVRDNKTLEKELVVTKEGKEFQTGIYIKDEIDGIGTLSYIDPETKIYASLGHEILETSSKNLFETSHGYIYDIELNYIHKSEDGNIGEYHANFKNNVLGSIEKNKTTGIYGKYQGTYQEEDLVEVGDKEEIKKGPAKIRLNVEGTEINDYEITILKTEENPVKNILFEITDEELLSKTGGIVQGMSGSPIIQENKVIGVVNYVLLNDSKKGYGIYIEKMLEEGDKLLQE